MEVESKTKEEKTDNNKTDEQAHFLTDLASAFVRYLDLQNATFLFQVIKPHLQKVCQ
jgi:hypothetical protein